VDFAQSTHATFFIQKCKAFFDSLQAQGIMAFECYFSDSSGQLYNNNRTYTYNGTSYNPSQTFYDLWNA